MNMQQIIQNFEHKNFDDSSLDFFKYLNVPLNRLIEESIDVNDLLGEHKDFSIIDTTYMVGGIDDNIFQGHHSNSALKIRRYEGLLVFAISLNISSPSRAQLSAISRIFNRKFQYTPVVILFKYANKLSLSNTQRQEYKQQWREGEQVGKVSILRDINIVNPHRGHLDILQNMKITSKVTSYETLYTYWQEVFDVSLLNKKFYQELSNWYSYAVSEVVFPNQPKDTENVEEHKSQNVIRLLTRFLFVWFIKEKGLIPNEIFDEEYIKEKLKDFNPKNMDGSLFGGHDKSSLYYKAILQNLFFASLNCPIKPLNSNDTRERGFRKKKHYGQNRDANFLMRYEDSFQNPQEFLELINKYVPFLNGGLFECLDDKTNGIYIDGFSDNLVKPHQLIVPDYLFFGVEEHVDLSTWYGSKNKSFKDATVKGLIKILDSYKFTVAENTPIEEDVALDPELLGRVFENLLASYNPETKSTARKQTGSFYTPREIVSYMVDESLIAYLKTKLDDRNNKLEEKIRELCSYSDKQPFEDEQTIVKLINALDNLKALDPAVGSGAFPMGMLQKMVHILSKLDPDNSYWQELQLDKAKQESDDVFETKNKEEREKLLIEINNAFDETINNPDYARKLYIVENSIYGVDIQSIAIQISKLRFFISLVIEQKIDDSKPNFGVRPLPNLETKFIAANTLIGIDKEKSNLFNDEKIKTLEQELKKIRHRLFNAKTPQTKRKLRVKDKELRENIANKLEQNGLGNESAKLLAHWDPYKQNESSPFFDMEWMFGIKDGFDIVIGNPPYVSVKGLSTFYKNQLSQHLSTANGRFNLFSLFIEKAISLSNSNVVTFIIPEGVYSNVEYRFIRELILKNTSINVISLFNKRVFEAAVDTTILSLKKKINNNKFKIYTDLYFFKNELNENEIYTYDNFLFPVNMNQTQYNITKMINLVSKYTINDFLEIQQGIIYSGQPKEIVFSEEPSLITHKKILDGRDISKWKINWNKKLDNKYINYTNNLHRPREERLFLSKDKILLPRKSTKISATIDYSQYYVLNTAYICLNKNNKLDTRYILALLNSKLLNFYYQSLYFGWQITIPALKSLPIINISDQKLFTLFVDILIYINKLENKLVLNYYEIILDGLIYELYFENHMKEKEINISEYAENDINQVMQNKNFESLNDAQKEQIIQELYDKWTHPDNEVRNRMKLFAVRSPDILKPILES